MFDFLRNWSKSAEEKRQEALNAYLDDALSPRQRAAFEAELAQDEMLRVELNRLRLVRENLGRLPRRRVPRNFMLDSAVYGRPTREPLVQAYPVLRFATVLTAFFFVLAVALQSFGGMTASRTADLAVEVTRVVTEEVAMEEAPAAAPMFDEGVAMEEMEAAPMAVEEMAEEPVAEEPAAEPMEEMAMDAAAEAEAPVVGETEDTAVAPPAAESAGSVGTAEGDYANAAATAMPATPTATPTLTPVATAVPTATPDIPRVPAETTPSGRAAPDLLTQNGAATAVPEPVLQETAVPVPTPAFPWLLVGLGLLFVLLVVLTFLARRRIL
ncbi:MAG: zf-HC2 domain-containing protein [Ardenticatenaceae bacterium]|nr:zf-HC2 domain-containing protein [Anaerolineales bacterium]MCB8920606.1 zf-HC2 domain-containing protein [Ardenticatenaceae bacterium]MCB8990230.1 zf-HC2 domain-containing protein [Ardenticatenaceae bacterium]MCB9002978.1 zf-HC2 domain-containing protein [Ardenticatenaceae bacterium]